MLPSWSSKAPRTLSPVFDYVLRALQQQPRTLLNLEAFFIRAPPHLCIPLLLSSASLTGFQPAPPPSSPPPTPLTFPLRDSEGSLRAEVRHHHRQHHHHPAVWPHRRRVRIDATIRATLPTVGVLRCCPPATLAPSPSLGCFVPSPPADERASPRLPPPL